ncbi:uncharacterized protein [Venturia canescens]|uniref:uncharacterized protein n=1 Tax=Venturia canescens TaxID=32260 RepID=UPI001C9C240C|nr:uncharacterized protein LOC122407135 [Venturia canescens]
MTTDWSNEITLQFIEIYKLEPVLWDRKHRHYKDKAVTTEAWNRLAKMMEMPVPELRRKKDSLMASFRQHARRKQKSLVSGGPATKIYQPSWFAYQAMEDFLFAIYKCEGLGSADDETTHYVQAEDWIETVENPITDDQLPKQPHSTYFHEAISRDSDLPDTSSRMDQTISPVNSIVSQKQNCEDDECDLYGKLIAKKLRKISEKDRQEIMYEIDGLLIRKTRCHNTSQSASP